MSQCYRTSRRVEFRDTDTAGIMHFSAFFIYMEQAEHELLRHLGMSVMTSDEDGTISWPRVSAHCDFDQPVRFEDVLDIDVTVERIGDRSVTYHCRFTSNGRRIAMGKLTSVCCRITSDGPPASIPIPDRIRQKLVTFHIEPQSKSAEQDSPREC